MTWGAPCRSHCRWGYVLALPPCLGGTVLADRGIGGSLEPAAIEINVCCFKKERKKHVEVTLYILFGVTFKDCTIYLLKF